MSSSTDTAYVTLNVADGSTMNAYVARPKAGTASAGMLVFQEAFGINDYMRRVTDRFASLGFLAIAPELFHRTGPGFEGSYTDYETIRPHMAALTPEGLNADIDAAYDWLRGASAGIAAPRIGAVGFCMGGRVAYMANARVQLGAAISFYGGVPPELLGLAQAQRAPILMFWGGLDKHILPEQYRAVADALTAANATHEQVVFSQADHGFFCDARASYNEIASKQAWALLTAFLDVYGLL